MRRHVSFYNRLKLVLKPFKQSFGFQEIHAVATLRCNQLYLIKFPIVFQKSLYRRCDAGVKDKIFIGHIINNNILTKSYNPFFTKHHTLVVKE